MLHVNNIKLQHATANIKTLAQEKNNSNKDN